MLIGILGKKDTKYIIHVPSLYNYEMHLSSLLSLSQND